MLLERPFEMPSSWVSLGSLGFTDHPILPGLPEERAGRLTFGTMNNPCKYAPESIALWARVLHRVPGSRILIVRPEAGVATFRENIERAFLSHGIAADRIAYAAVRGQHLGALQRHRHRPGHRPADRRRALRLGLRETIRQSPLGAGFSDPDHSYIGTNTRGRQRGG